MTNKQILELLIDAKDYVDLIIIFGGVPGDDELLLQERLGKAIETLKEDQSSLPTSD